LTVSRFFSGEYEQGSKGRWELPKLQKTSQFNQSTSDGVARAREQLESSCGGNAAKWTETEGDAGDPGLASQAEVGARSRACVKKRRSMPSGPAATNRGFFQHTGDDAVCVPNDGTIMAGHGK